MIVFPNAKINLGLHIVSKRSDGYHNLETVFYPVPLADVLEMIESDKTGISSTGLPIEGNSENNLIIKAFNSLKNDFDLPPVQFHLHKLIPTGAGLGGGSSDAAFTLNMLNDYFNLRLSVEQLKSYAAAIGADCAFFIENKPAFATGIGNVLEPIALDLSNYKIVIVKPPVAVSTVQAYKNIVPRKPKYSLQQLPILPIEQWKDSLMNDFEDSIFPEYPEIQQLKHLLYEAGAVYASMSGSGSAVYGLFNEIPSNLKNALPGNVWLNI